VYTNPSASMTVTWTKNLISRSLISAFIALSKNKMKKHPQSINKMQKIIDKLRMEMHVHYFFNKVSTIKTSTN
jgi:flagellin-specific chaperone FliS